MNPAFETFCDELSAFSVPRSRLLEYRAEIEVAIQAAIARRDDCPEEAFFESMAAAGVPDSRLELIRERIDAAIYAVLLDLDAHADVVRRTKPVKHPRKPRVERVYTAADDEAIRADIASGMHWREIRAKHGCSFSHIVKVRGGWQRKRKITKVDDAMAERIRARLAAGEQGRDVALSEGISEATVSQIKHRRTHGRREAA